MLCNKNSRVATNSHCQCNFAHQDVTICDSQTRQQTLSDVTPVVVFVVAGIVVVVVFVVEGIVVIVVFVAGVTPG